MNYTQYPLEIVKITVAKSLCKDLPKKNFLPTSLALEANNKHSYEKHTNLLIYGQRLILKHIYM